LNVVIIPRSFNKGKELTMATPMNMDGGRHAFRAPKLGTRKPVTGVKVTVTLVSKETAKARKARHAAETGTGRGMWK
jgi:hypothetical protein